MSVIANTTVISNFAAISRLDVLHRLLGEVQDGLSEGFNFYAGIESHIHPLTPGGWLRLASMDDEELRLFSQLPEALHRGEASCLAIAAKRGWAFLTDDARARKASQELKVTYSGTLGVLVQAVKAGLLPLGEANTMLDRMIQAGYRSPFTTLAELL